MNRRVTGIKSDEVLIERIRPILSGEKGFSERKMFGSVCFMINGNMSARPPPESLIVRLGRENHHKTLAEPHTRLADIAGRVMKGWALVEPAGIECENNLRAWVVRAARFARSLPAK